MKEITTLEELKEAAITINRTFRVVSYETNKEETLEPNEESLLRHLEKGYRTKRGMIAFVTENTMYVIPYMSRVIKILVENGFEQKYMVVPFSRSNYPIEAKDQWEELIMMAHESQLNEFSTDCNKFCDEHEFGAIDETLFQMCFEMPSYGVRVKNSCGEYIYYYPAIIRSYLDYTAVEKLGKYGTKNGITAFVYRDGKTYVTRSQKVLEAIIKADYIEEKDLVVPFANGEEIHNQGYANLWKKICESV